MKKSHIFLSLIVLTLLFSTAAFSQSLYFEYSYQFEPIIADTPPDVSGSPSIDFPEDARKNGVEGVVKASLTLGANGRTSDISITQGLSKNIDDAVTRGLQNFYFKPASLKGQPVSARMLFEFTVSALYTENDKNAGKPKFISQPEAVYPEKYRNEKWKETVTVRILFNANGTLKVLGSSSVMPREFDQAAIEAARQIKFQPALHKKSKKPISVEMTVEYKFKS